MGCVSSREKSSYPEDNSSINKHDKNYLLKMLIIRTNYEKYTFRVRGDPEDAFEDIRKCWEKLSKNVNERSFPNLSDEFNEVEDSFLDETEEIEELPEESKKFIRKNTIALKNLEIVNIEPAAPQPPTPMFSLSKFLVDKIKEINTDRSLKAMVKKDSLEGFGNLLSPGSRVGRGSQVSFDLLSKKN